MVEAIREKSKPKNVLPKPASERVELVRRRTPYSSEYLNPDGTFSVELFAQPVHFKNKRGYLQKIDNTLITSVRGGYEYVNKDNAFTVQFARNNQNNQLVRISYDDDHWMEFSPIGKFTSIGSAKDSTIYYKGIRTDVDLRYVVGNDRVKEEIILNKYPASNIFTFTLTAQGMDFIKGEDGIIWVINQDTGEQLFYLQKAYGEDAAGNVTYNLRTDIVDTAEGRQLNVVVDSQWLQTAQYPVIIDPSIGVNLQSDVDDTYVSSINSEAFYHDNNYLHAGFLSGYGTIRSYVRFRYLPSLPSGAKILNAFLKLFMYLPSTNGTTINVYAVTQPWESANVKWSNKPDTEAIPIIESFSSAANTEWSLGITGLAQKWYQGETPNYGVMIRASNEANAKISFFSGNAVGNPIPKLTINYEIDALGSEPFFGFDGNVNLYNGNLVLSAVDVSLPGRGIPILVSRTYNLRSEETTTLGYRWRLNVGMRISFAADESVVGFVDGDGTVKYFTKQAGTTYKSPVGIQLTLKKESDVFILEEREGTKYYFTTDGRLDKIVDTNNNVTDIAYQADGNIARIVDPSGRIVTFNYTSGKLTSITGSDIPTVVYGYTGENLTTVQKKGTDGKVLDQVTFGYDTYKNLRTATDFLDQTTGIDYSYTEQLGRRAHRISKSLTIDGVLQSVNTTYTYVQTSSGVTTTVTNPRGYVTEYKTNNMGNLVEIREDKNGLNLTTQLKWDEEQNLVEGIPPRGLGQENIYNTVIQYDKNGNVTKVENAKGKNAIYKYNEKHDVTEAVDFVGRPSIYAFDPRSRNVTATADPLFASTVTNYDSYGNITSETDPIGLGGNLLSNTNFENWTSGLPIQWSKLTSGGTITQDATNKVNGNFSVKLTASGSLDNQKVALISNSIKIEKSSKYNISWYVKTQNVLSAGGELRLLCIGMLQMAPHGWEVFRILDPPSEHRESSFEKEPESTHRRMQSTPK